MVKDIILGTKHQLLAGSIYALIDIEYDETDFPSMKLNIFQGNDTVCTTSLSIFGPTKQFLEDLSDIFKTLSESDGLSTENSRMNNG